MMEAVSRLAGGIAHDFNNILTTIAGCGHLLKDGISSNPHYARYLDRLLSASEKASELTRGLLAFSRNQVLSLRKTDLNEVVENAGRSLQGLVGENIEMSIHTSSAPLFALADGRQLEQLMINLAMNARDAMPEGGCFTIETEQTCLDEGFIAAYGYGKAGAYARISVSDTGAGMDESIRANIFEPFFTTKETGKGAGLGLAIVYGIVSQHHGYITVNSRQGIGTIFKIYFPIADTPAPVCKKVI